MKNEEAIKYFESHFPKGLHMGEPTQQKQAYNTAIDALDKQIPKKPSRTKGPFEETIICPVCHSVLSPRNKILYMDDYCHKCGQAIDWIGKEQKNDSN